MSMQCDYIKLDDKKERRKATVSLFPSKDDTTIELKKERNSWPTGLDSQSKERRRLSTPIDAKAKNSIEMLVKKEAEKDQKRIKGKYFANCLILMELSELDEKDGSDAIWQHSIQKILRYQHQPSKRNKKKDKIWSEIKNVEIENIDLFNQLKPKMSPQEIADLTEPFAQCLMDVIQYTLEINCSSQTVYDLMFTCAGFQRKAQEQIIEVIKGCIAVKIDDKDCEEFIEREMERLEFFRRHPRKKKGKVLLVYENLANAAFIAIGYRMVVYRQSLRKVYNLFRNHMKEIPILHKLQIYVLQSLDFARFGIVTMSLDHFRYHNVTGALAEQFCEQNDYARKCGI